MNLKNITFKKEFVGRDFSQHKESTFLYNYIKKNNVNLPNTFVDIGSHDGVTNSNSRLFQNNGFYCIYFEPNPLLFSRLVGNTIKYNEKEIYNLAVSDKFGKVKFNIVTKKNFEGHSSIDENGNHSVIAVSLKSIWDKEIGILDIDAEGHDTKILKNIIDGGIRPHFVIIESNSKEERQKQVNILTEEYELIHTIKVNTIWRLKKTF